MEPQRKRGTRLLKDSASKGVNLVLGGLMAPTLTVFHTVVPRNLREAFSEYIVQTNIVIWEVFLQVFNGVFHNN